MVAAMGEAGHSRLTIAGADRWLAVVRVSPIGSGVSAPSSESTQFANPSPLTHQEPRFCRRRRRGKAASAAAAISSETPDGLEAWA